MVYVGLSWNVGMFVGDLWRGLGNYLGYVRGYVIEVVLWYVLGVSELSYISVLLV